MDKGGESVVISKNSLIQVGDWTFYPDQFKIEKGNESVKLEPRTAHLLLYLAQHAGKSCSREELIENAWPHAVIGDEVLTSAINKLRKATTDSSQQPRYIETIPKLGYRLIAAVNIMEDGNEPKASSLDRLPGNGKNTIPSRHLFRGSIAIAVILLVGAFSLWHVSDRSPVSSPDQASVNKDLADQDIPIYIPTQIHSIAVLPFTNLSGDADQEYFADGMTDDLITDLSKIPGLTVISRTSSFAFKGKYKDVREIARKLNARFVVEGSARRSADTIRINVQLIDAKTGNHIWADSYDREQGEIFTLQDSITNRIVNALIPEVKIVAPDKLKRRNPADLKAYDLFLKANAIFQRFSKEDTYLARELFEIVTKLDPEFSRAFAMLAWTYVFEYNNGWSPDPNNTLQTALHLANKSIALHGNMPISHFVKGLVYRERNEFDKAEVEAKKAIEIEPSYANGYVLSATLQYYAGKPKEGLEMLNIASTLNPIHPSNYPFHKGQAYFILEKYNEAIREFKDGLNRNPTSERLRVWLAATYAQVDLIEEANWEAVQILNEDPSFSLSNLESIFPFVNSEDKQRFNSALRKAGFDKQSIH